MKILKRFLYLLLIASLFVAPVHAQDDGQGPNADRIERLMHGMTTREKVAQLLLVPVTTAGVTPGLEAFLREYTPGGVVLFNQIASTPAEVLALTNAMQAAATTEGVGIPLLVAADQEGWPVSRLQLGFTIFPNNMVIAAAGKGRFAADVAQLAAAEMRAVGINMNLAPVTDVNSNPLNAVIDVRAFGSDPAMVGALAATVIEGLQSQGVMATAKHFPGHGDTSIDSHDSLPVVRRFHYQLEEVELVPFQRVIDAGVDAVMTAHVSYPAFDQTPDLPATFSKAIVTDLLRGRMGFKGVIISDSLLMGAITERYELTEAAELAFRAGVDMLAYGSVQDIDYEMLAPVVEHLASLVEGGDIPVERLNQSVRRVLALKKRYGLLDWTPPPEEGLARVGTVFNDSFVKTVAQEAITLVRDDNLLLPLEAGEGVVMAYPQALAPWLAEYARALDPGVTLVPVDADPTRAQIDAVRRAVGRSDRLVVFTCDARHSPAQVKLVTTFDPEQVIVVALCSPYDLLAFPDVKTYLATYWELPLPVEGVMDVLYGKAEPGGSLPVALLSFPVGHGLYAFPRSAGAPGS